MSGSKVFTVMVVGNNPTELMEKYDINREVEPYVIYKYKDADKMRNNSIKILEGIIKDPKKFNLKGNNIETIKNNLDTIKKMTKFEYYQNLVNGYFINDDGDAISTNNPNGKWLSYNLGKSFSLPLKLYNGDEVFEALNKDIDWDSMHMQNTSVYDAVWEMVVEGREPKNEHEKLLYNNMSVHKNYFQKFKNKDEYVIHNCAYWNYGYLDESGWHDMDDAKSEFDWISNYFNNFIPNLKENDKVSIFECYRNKE